MRGTGAIVANLAGIGGYFLLRQAGVPMMVMAIVMCWAVGVMAVGWMAGRVLSSAIDCDSTTIQIVSWSQLVTWWYPPLGLFLSIATWQLADGAYSNGLKMRFLSTFGGLAAMLCGAVGIFLQYRAAAGV